ncbi:uncharacterized protein LOC135489931 [Lineus longissimus]|uniref:uncharacterized protein LOC135489931 n=1 Tax=Lineus longissimus TaxID=88925 RepID=UPI00315D75C5
MKDWGIIHIESSPGHHSANGRAEAAVKIAKQLLIKARKTRTDPNIALLELRNTPRENTGQSPTEMLLGHKTRSVIPYMEKGDIEVSKGRKMRKSAMKRSYDKKACALPKLSVGQSVYFEKKEKERWILGKVVQILGNRTYLIESRAGGVYRRNRSQMRHTSVPFVREPPFLFPPPPVSGSVNPTGNVDHSVERAPTIQPSHGFNETGASDSNPDESTSGAVQSTDAPTRRSSRVSKPPKYLADYVPK